MRSGVHQDSQQGCGIFCVPTYDIDLMWHAHQLCPSAYGADCARLFGGLKDHDDSDQDRTQGSKLSDGHRDTELAWERLFGKAYPRAGCMYRGRHRTRWTSQACCCGGPRRWMGPWARCLCSHCHPQPLPQRLRPLLLWPLPPVAPGPGQGIATAEAHPSLQKPKPSPSSPKDVGKRMMVEVMLCIRGLENYQNIPSHHGLLCLHVEALAGYTGVLAKSEPFQAGTPAPCLRLRCGLSLGTKGLRISLVRAGSTRVLASVALKNDRGFDSPSAWDMSFPLQVTSDAAKRFHRALDRITQGLRRSRAVNDPEVKAKGIEDPLLLLSLSVTAPTEANRLLALVPSPTRDAQQLGPPYQAERRRRRQGRGRGVAHAHCRGPQGRREVRAAHAPGGCRLHVPEAQD